MVHYIANAFFELELEGRVENDLKSAIEKNLIFKQLQYLPLLYLSPEDTLLVTEIPSQRYLDSLEFPLPQIALIENKFHGDVLKGWGASALIAKWAKNQWKMPSLECARNVNSKLWNFQDILKGARIVSSIEEVEHAVQGTSYNWVLKTDQGFAGRGHVIFNHQTIDKAFRAVKKGKMILEPWVERLLDFSSQWYLSKGGGIDLLGLTKCINTPSGTYLGTETGDEALVFGRYLPQVVAHVDYCKVYLQRVVKEGFFGHLGIDAMIYGEDLLHPIVEVNARMTLSAAILLYHQKHVKDEVTRIYFSPGNTNKKSLLPEGYHRKLIIM